MLIPHPTDTCSLTLRTLLIIHAHSWQREILPTSRRKYRARERMNFAILLSGG
jgi:predicted type IV restriction endonuclease